MKFIRLVLENWRNFKRVDVPLHRRAFIVGPNASGKSNLLDAFRFLREVADPQGGFQRAVDSRGGVSQIRSLFARHKSNVTIEATIDLGAGKPWNYKLEFGQNPQRRPVIKREIVWRSDSPVIISRPDKEDEADPSRLTQTYLEQVNANKLFREVAEFFSRVRYLHIVPQLIREPERSVGRERDPFGGDFLEQLATTPIKTRQSRLRQIQGALKIAIPQLEKLELIRDARGVPHLRGLYQHWRPNAGWQAEDQLSDGTLRLLGLLWSLLDGDAPLLLEEPELSLHTAVVRQVPRMMARIARRSGRQVLLSSHSADLLSDEGIAPQEVLVLEPSSEGTKVRVAADVPEIKALLEGGLSVADAVLPRTAPQDADQLSVFPE